MFVITIITIIERNKIKRYIINIKIPFILLFLLSSILSENPFLKETSSEIYKGTKYRNIIPMSVEFKATQWHPEEQWILNAMDVDKNAQRAFAIKDIKEWKVN